VRVEVPSADDAIFNPARPVLAKCLMENTILVARALHIQGTTGPALVRMTKERRMNWDRIQGNWKQLTGKVKEQWGKLTDDDIDRIAGKRDQLAGKLQESYGITKDEAEKQIDSFENRYGDYGAASRDATIRH
jgi:uncharacterized protein YjbJ (UPF0337 family)